MHTRLVRIALGLLMLAGIGVAPAAAAGDGILLLAHGGKQEWNDRVDAVASAIRKDVPIEIAFGMATRPNIQAAVDRLAAKGVSRIVAVPLFISSHSSVVTSTEYLLGLRTDMPEDLKLFARMNHGHGVPAAPAAAAPATAADAHAHHGPASGGHAGHAPAADADENLRPVKSPVPIVMTSAMNSHPLVGEILLARARAMSQAPEREAVILVAHGPVSEENNKRWLSDMRTLAAQVQGGSTFASVDYLTVRDDAPAEIRDKATAELRQIVQRRTAEGRRALIVPLLMTYGGIEQGIRKRLEGLDYTMAGSGLLPDARVEKWIRASAAAAK